MTAQTTTQRTAKHRLAVKERMARMTEALEAIASMDPVEMMLDPLWASRLARGALVGPVAAKIPE